MVRHLRLNIREYYWRNISECSKKWEKNQTRQVFSLCSGQFLFVYSLVIFLLFAWVHFLTTALSYVIVNISFQPSFSFIYFWKTKPPQSFIFFCKWTWLLILNSLWCRHVFMEKLLLIGTAKASHWPYRVILAWLFIILVCSDQIN